MNKILTALLLINVAWAGAGCADSQPPAPAVQNADGTQSIRILVQHGYQPSQVVAESGKPLKIEFYRDEEPGQHSCVEEVVIPEENIKLHLPARESQIVELKPHQPGEIVFQCGMDMVHGKITFK